MKLSIIRRLQAVSIVAAVLSVGALAMADKGKTRDELVGMLGSSMVENGQWSAGNPFAPVFGGPDFFGAGRYGGQCTWFAQAVRGESLPTGNAGYGGWVTDWAATRQLQK